MSPFKGKYWVSLVIVAILSISLKDGVGIVHEILHFIPNPFHYHLSITPHFHDHLGEESHHHSIADHYEISFEKKHQHSDASKETNKEENNSEEDLKIDLFHKSINHQYFLGVMDYKLGSYLHWDNFYSSFLQCPPTPPPKSSIS